MARCWYKTPPAPGTGVMVVEAKQVREEMLQNTAVSSRPCAGTSISCADGDVDKLMEGETT